MSTERWMRARRSSERESYKRVHTVKKSADGKKNKSGRVTNSDVYFFMMIRRAPRSTRSRSSAASDVYKETAFKFFVRAIWQF